jgi:Uma2 family endonuclease
MSATQTVSLEEYLRTVYRPDQEWVNGELRERHLGQFDHANLQGALVALLRSKQKEWRVIVLPEQRLRVKADRYRIPDILIVPEGYDRSPIVTIPPLLCIEILSPDDSLMELTERADDYLSMGTSQVWIFDPTKRRVYLIANGVFREVSTETALECGPIRLDLPELFASL